MLERYITALLALMIFAGAFTTGRRTRDSYVALERVSLLALLCSGVGAILGTASFPLLAAQLGTPAIAGVLLGSWPDGVTGLPQRLRTEGRDLMGAMPDLVAASLGVILGAWAWSALAGAFGLLGALGGIMVFPAAVLGIGLMPEVVRAILDTLAERKNRGRGSDGVSGKGPG